MDKTTGADDAVIPLMDAQESPIAAAIARAGLRKPLPFVDEIPVIERFITDFNGSDAALALPGGRLQDIAIDSRGSSKSITASNGNVTVAFRENDGRRTASISRQGHTSTRTVLTAADAVDYLSVEMAGLCAP